MCTISTVYARHAVLPAIRTATKARQFSPQLVQGKRAPAHERIPQQKDVLAVLPQASRPLPNAFFLRGCGSKPLWGRKYAPYFFDVIITAAGTRQVVLPLPRFFRGPCAAGPQRPLVNSPADKEIGPCNGKTSLQLPPIRSSRLSLEKYKVAQKMPDSLEAVNTIRKLLGEGKPLISAVDAHSFVATGTACGRHSVAARARGPSLSEGKAFL